MFKKNPPGEKTLQQGFWAIGDQAFVSAANFLTIAIGAQLLPLPEQAKLVYTYGAYIALFVFNGAALFSAAPILRYQVKDVSAYRRSLLMFQCGIAVVSSLLTAVVLRLAGGVLDWDPEFHEIFALVTFLLLQQLNDFNRRAEYVFGATNCSFAISFTTLALRIGLLLTFRPMKVETVCYLLVLAALPGALAVFFLGSRFSAESKKEKGVLKRHFLIARWNIASAPLRWSGLHLPIFMVGALAGAEPAAILASIRSIGTFANVFLELFETFIPAWLAKRAHETGQSGANRSVLVLSLIGGGAWLITFLLIVGFGEILLNLALGPIYATHWTLLVYLWVGNGFNFVGRLAGICHRIVGKAWVEFAGSASGFLFLILGFPLIIKFSYYGGAWTIILVQMGTVAGQYFFSRYYGRYLPNLLTIVK